MPIASPPPQPHDSRSAVVDLNSDGDGSGSIDGLGQLALATQSVSLDIAVDNYAAAALVETSGGGTFAQNGAAYTLNLGTITKAEHGGDWSCGKNAASGAADRCRALSPKLATTSSPMR